MPERIELHELPLRMRRIADDLCRVGAAIRYYGGVGPFAEYGQMLEATTAPLMRELAHALEGMQGGHA